MTNRDLSINFEKVCRLCLIQPRKKQKNYENFLAKVAPKYQQQISDLLEAHNVMISDEELPKVFCNECFDFLPKFFEFHQKCVDSSRTLNEIHSNRLTEIKDENKIKEESLDIDGFDASSTDLQIATTQTIKGESADEYEDDGATGDDDNDEMDSTSEPQTDTEVPLNGKKSCNKRKARQCNICGKIVHRLPIHMLSHTKEKKHQCPHCERSFSTKGNLTTHVDIHLNNRKYKCHICPKDFVSSSSFRKHLLVHSGTRNHHCDLCDKSFNQLYTLRMHKKMHAQDRPNECPTCQKKFYTGFQLRQHQKTHSARLKCSMCPKEFKTQVYLEIHLRTHTGLSPYSCDLCGKHFSSGSSLANHVKTHSSKEPSKVQVMKIAAVVPNVAHQIVVSEILTLSST